jgi:DNA-binding NarL/FixJ family response regulator
MIAHTLTTLRQTIERTLHLRGELTAEIHHARLHVRQAKALLQQEPVAEPQEPTLPSQPRLTKRQLQILRLTSEGRKNREIATALGLSEKTVEFHKANLAKRLGVTSTAGIVRFALQNGFS